MHGGGDPGDLPGLLDRLAELRRQEGTGNRPFHVYAISMDAFSVDGVRRLEDQGVTDVIVGCRWPYTTDTDKQPLDDKIGALNKYAERIIAKLSG